MSEPTRAQKVTASVGVQENYTGNSWFLQYEHGTKYNIQVLLRYSFRDRPHSRSLVIGCVEPKHLASIVWARIWYTIGRIFNAPQFPYH